MTTSPTPNKGKAPAWFVVLFLAGIGFLMTRWISCGTEDAERTAATDDLKEAWNTSVQAGMLPGFDPYQAVGALENSGLTPTKRAVEDGVNYHFQGVDNGIELTADLNIWKKQASGLTALAIVGTNPDIQAARPFIGYVATLPYQGAQPEQARSWIEANYDIDSASTVIGEAHFLLRSTDGSRMLIIRRNTQ